MSYIEHGPRIFLTGLPNAGMPLAYGDYANPSRKRSEGKLKLHDSCSDLRAWSLNTMESSQYFRELTEHVAPGGSIIPYNVIIDHIIGLTSKAQNELHLVKRELQKYKTLELTSKQQEQLRSFDKLHSESGQRLPEPNHHGFRKSLFRNAIFDFNKSLPQLYPHPQLPINLLRSPTKLTEKSSERNVSSSRSDSSGEYANVELQVMQDMHDVGMQVNEYPVMKVPFDSVRIISVASDRSLEFDPSDSEGSETLPKQFIIEKDSEIISLKNDLCVKDVELEELQKSKEEMMKSLQERLKACHDELMEVEEQRTREVDDLKEKLSTCTTLIQQLKDDLNRKELANHMQVQEIAKLQTYVDEISTLRVENESLTNKVVQLEEKSDKANATLVELRIALREEQMLKEKVQERNCLLADKEDEIGYLMMIIDKISTECNQQKTMDQNTPLKSLVEDLKKAVQNKDIQLAEYEKRTATMQQDIKTFFSNLRKSLNNFDELTEMCDDSHNSTKCIFDENDEPDGVLYNMNVIMTRLQSYKMERLELLQKIRKLQGYTNTEEESAYNFSEDENLLAKKRRRSEDCEVDQAFSDSVCEINVESTMDELESQIINQVSCALQKIESLMEDFREYAESEQPELIKRIQNVGKVLNDIACILNNSQNINSRKEVISEMYEELKENRTDMEQSSKNVPAQLRVTVLNIYDSIETILNAQLQELSSAEARDLSEKHIDIIFNQHLKCCISRTKGIFEGTEKKCFQLENVLNKQQQIVQENLKELNRLKQIIEKYKIQHDKSRKELRDAASELSAKKESMSKLEGKIKLSEMKLSKLSKNCMRLKQLNKSLECDRNRLEKEQQLANDKLQSQTLELRSLKDSTDNNTNALKNQMSKMENSLLSLVYENDVLRAKICAASEKDETIESLRNSIEKQKSVHSSMLLEYKQTVAEKQSQILTLRTENEMLCRRLCDTERELTKKSEEMVVLYEEKSKVDLIHTLQKDLVGLNKNGQKLKTHLNKLKRIYVNEQNKSRKVENELDANLRQNEALQNEVEYWKNKNSQFLKQAQQEITNESSNRRMRNLSNELYERIVKLTRMTNDTSDQHTLMRDQVEHYERMVETTFKSDFAILDKDQNGLYTAIFNRDEKIKELNTRIKRFEAERNEKQNEIDRLFHDMKNKDSEIKSLKQSRNWLIQEKLHLQDARKHEVDEYQKTIMLMKKNYNSSVHALSTKHNESIMRLEMRFQDTMNSDQNSFDSETQMQSLDKQSLIVHDLCDFHVTENSVSLQTKIHAGEKHERLNFASEGEPKFGNTSYNDHAVQPFFGSNYEIRIQPQNNNIYQQRNIGLSEAGKQNQACRDMKHQPYNTIKKNNVLDQQRWNFISRCSLYLKFGNIHHYS